MKKAVIFDLDGTIADTLSSIAYCANRALNRYGLPSLEAEAYKSCVGDGARVLIERALILAGDARLQHFEEVFEEYVRLFRTDCTYEVRPYDGICEALREIRENGGRTAVLSNKPHRNTLTVIHSVFGDSAFDAVLGQRDGMPKKPDPAGAREIMSSLCVQAEDCLYVGDSGVDMRTGRAAGIYTIGVLWGFRDEKELMENGADRVITSPAELVGCFKSL